MFDLCLLEIGTDFQTIDLPSLQQTEDKIMKWLFFLAIALNVLAAVACSAAGSMAIAFSGASIAIGLAAVIIFGGHHFGMR